MENLRKQSPTGKRQKNQHLTISTIPFVQDIPPHRLAAWPYLLQAHLQHEGFLYLLLRQVDGHAGDNSRSRGRRGGFRQTVRGPPGGEQKCTTKKKKKTISSALSGAPYICSNSHNTYTIATDIQAVRDVRSRTRGKTVNLCHGTDRCRCWGISQASWRRDSFVWVETRSV